MSVALWLFGSKNDSFDEKARDICAEREASEPWSECVERETRKLRLEARREALRFCREKLDPEDRQILDRCYAANSSVSEVARASGRPPTSVYRTLRRIRRQLGVCIDQSIAGGTV